jgi:phage terminase large subunit-like protein
MTLVEPAYLWTPPRAGSLAEDVADLSETVGRILDPEQILAVDALTSVDEDGKWTSLNNVVICPRQNLKTFILECIVLTKLFVWDEKLIMWTAHEFATAEESFKHFDELIGSYDHLARRVRRIGRENGAEEFELHSGSVLRFRARTKSGGRGISGDTVVLDEAFALQAHHMGSLIPTMSARPNPQALYGSSAALATSTILRRLMKSGRAGDWSGSYVEWQAEPGSCELGDGCDHALGTPGCACDDMERIHRGNPAYGTRITPKFIREERDTLPPAEFARERMGWEDPDPQDDRKPITVEAWSECLDMDSRLEDGAAVFLAADVSPGQKSAAIVACGRRADGTPHLEVIEHREGVTWLVDRIAGIIDRHEVTAVVADQKSAAGVLAPDFEAAEIDVHWVTLAEHAEACGWLQRAVTARTLAYVDRPLQPILANSLESAVSRDVGDGGWAWARRKSAGDICPLVAATLAHWACTTSEDLSGYDPTEGVF